MRLPIEAATTGPRPYSGDWVERDLLRSPQQKRRKATARSDGKTKLQLAASIVGSTTPNTI